MESLVERIAKLEYYQLLLLEMIDDERLPFYQLIIKARLTKQEVEDLLSFCEELNKQYEKQKAEGFVVFSPLLTQFAGMLHPKLNPEATIFALFNQGMYTGLMTEFRKIISIER